MKNLSVKHEYFVRVILLSVIFLFILLEIILALTPPVARDVLIHHLAIPKLWLIHGGFYEIPWAGFSYYPMNLSLLYLVPLYFGNDIIPNLIHLSFGVGTAILLYVYLNKKSGQLAGLLAALIFISLPTILRTATTAYVDVGLVFFTTLSVLAYVYWRDAEYKSHGWLLVSAIAMGLALGTKYSALPAWFFLTLAIVFIYSKDTGGQVRALLHGLVFFIVSLLVFSPWLIKNAILTGNPLYPLYQSVLNAGVASLSEAYVEASAGSGMGMFKMRQMLFGDNFLETLLIPFRFFLQGQDHTPRYFDGVLNPVLIFIAPLAFMNRKMKPDKLLFLAFAAFFILLAFFMDQHRIRYILPAVPFVIILTVLGFVNLFNWIMDRQKPLQTFC
ncbi:MAG: phospholipid carrier-dependent glycosyltransferase, partial [Smithellaceae bacterium]